MFLVISRIVDWVDVANVLGDVPVRKGPDEDSSRLLPLHGCPGDERCCGSVASEGSRTSRRWPTASSRVVTVREEWLVCSS
eukprot:9045251-Heterocapsa_arctica.AAC.1